MKNLTKFCAGLAVAALLTSCSSSYSETTYEDFHAKALEAADKRTESDYTVVTSKGSLVSNGTTYDLSCNIDYANETTTGDTVAVFTILGLVDTTADTATYDESDDATCGWYVGNAGFKATIKDGEADYTYVWNTLGYLTSVKGKEGANSINLTISYK